MKILLISFALFLACFAAKAQTVGSATAIFGTNRFAVQTSPGIYQTNSIYFGGAFKTLTLSQIYSTNENFVYWYSVQIPTNQIVFEPGLNGTNYWVISGFITNSFATGTNAGAWSTNFSTAGLTLPFPLYFGCITGTNLVGINTNLLYIP